VADELKAIDPRFDRAYQMADDWAAVLDEATDRPLRREMLELYVRTDSDDDRSVANADGSITLGARTAYWTRIVGERMFNAQYVGQYHPTRAEAENIRNALDEFAGVYEATVRPSAAALSAASQALDQGLRANVVLPRVIRTSRINEAFPEIARLNDRHPLLQGAARTLTEKLGTRLGMQTGELDELLARTPAAQRLDALADVLITNDPLQRRLPDGSPRNPPADHVARLKALLTRELNETFRQCHEEIGWNGSDTWRGNTLAAAAVTRLNAHLAESRDEITTDQRGYQQVAAVMSVVQTELSMGRASASRGRDGGAWALQLKMKSDYWNGELKATDLPDGALGLAGTDRSLTLDQEKVIDVLAAADRSGPPSAELRDAVDAVATQATRLCNPSAPGTVPNDAAGQAFEEQLSRDFLSGQQTRLYAALGFTEDQLDAGTPQSATATARVVATLTETAARNLGLEPHEITARLLTTPPDERIERAAALSIGDPDTVVDRSQWDDATKSLAENIQTTLTRAAEADQAGQTKLHAWNRATAGEKLSHQLTTAINKAAKPVTRTSASGNEALLRSMAAATSGQPRPGSGRGNGSDPVTGRSRQPDKPKSGRGVNGRG
jgi:hypothetical protein